MRGRWHRASPASPMTDEVARSAGTVRVGCGSFPPHPPRFAQHLLLKEKALLCHSERSEESESPVPYRECTLPPAAHFSLSCQREVSKRNALSWEGICFLGSTSALPKRRKSGFRKCPICCYRAGFGPNRWPGGPSNDVELPWIIATPLQGNDPPSHRRGEHRSPAECVRAAIYVILSEAKNLFFQILRRRLLRMTCRRP